LKYSELTRQIAIVDVLLTAAQRGFEECLSRSDGTLNCAARWQRAGMVEAVKTNVTLKLDADLLREARVVAAEEGRSISALLADRLESIVRERKAFDKARRRALARLRDGLDLQWTPPKSRDELHER
jgi:hypothetical protein